MALYPKEGTFWHEHPFGIPNAEWVTEEQRAAAKVFTEYVRGEAVQQRVLESGFRPVNPAVPLGYPIVADLGVDPDQPAAVLTVPDPEVIAAVQASWQYVKKQGDVMLVIDVSGSMQGDKIEQVREAASEFLDSMPTQNRIGLMVFNQEPQILHPLASWEATHDDIKRSVGGLQADGDTALYDTLLDAIDHLRSIEEGEDRIRAIVLLSDGKDTVSEASLNDVINRLEEARTGRNPILVIPVAYGSDADIAALNSIARASATKVQSGAPEDILQVLEIISSYF